MSISKERLEEIRRIEDIDYSDCPKLTREQFANARPCHLVNREVQAIRNDESKRSHES